LICSAKKALNLRERGLYTLERIYVKEHYESPKEPCIYAQELYVFVPGGGIAGIAGFFVEI